jgi:hypothetical protein
VAALGSWGDAGTQALGFFLVVGLPVFLGYVSIKLVRRRPGALSLGGWLLGLELVGAALLVGSFGDISERRDYALLFAWGCVVIVLWVLPNVAILYKARGLFVEDAGSKK